MSGLFRSSTRVASLPGQQRPRWENFMSDHLGLGCLPERSNHTRPIQQSLPQSRSGRIFQKQYPQSNRRSRHQVFEGPRSFSPRPRRRSLAPHDFLRQSKSNHTRLHRLLRQTDGAEPPDRAPRYPQTIIGIIGRTGSGTPGHPRAQAQDNSTLALVPMSNTHLSREPLHGMKRP